MKKLLFPFFGLLMTTIAIAQVQNPVKWNYTAKRIADKTFEVHITGTIGPGWHVYTLDPKSDTGVATSVKFIKHPLATPEDDLQIRGKLVSMKDPSTGEMVKFFTNYVDLIQVYKLKTAASTTIKGTLQYTACDDKHCLPTTSKSFTVALQ